jgi:IS30 family transposase
MSHGRCTPCETSGSRNSENNNTKFMNESIVSAEAKARLTEAVKNYVPPAPKKYRALEEIKECVIELRNKRASYQTIRTMLHDNAGIEVSHQTIARYCREMLDSKPIRTARKTQRSRNTSDKISPTSQKKFSTQPTSALLFDGSQGRASRQ